MPSIRVLRQSYGLTLVELALRSGIPARTLGEIEYGFQELDPNNRARLAHVFGVRPDLLAAARPAPPAHSISLHHATALVFALTSALLLTPLITNRQLPSAALTWGSAARYEVRAIPVQQGGPPAPRWLPERTNGRGAALPSVAPSRTSVSPSPTATPTATSAPTPEPTSPPPTAKPALPEPTSAPPPLEPPPELATAALAAEPPPPELATAAPAAEPPPPLAVAEPTIEAPTPEPPAPPAVTQMPDQPEPPPAFSLEADGPHGCPLIVNQGRIVITQGYGVGSHAPAATWGALDLGVDGNGDGFAEPGATEGVTIVATHGGVAHVFPNSWPGGNFILVENAQAGWSTAYAHLGSIAVGDGQTVLAGTPIGSVGSTGMATGPHLHYEVRHGGINLDPSPLIGCGS